jgi:hypothetical protein
MQRICLLPIKESGEGKLARGCPDSYSFNIRVYVQLQRAHSGLVTHHGFGIKQNIVTVIGSQGGTAIAGAAREARRPQRSKSAGFVNQQMARNDLKKEA